MIRSFLFFAFLTIITWVNAQSIAVKDFKAAPDDLDARVNYPKTDQNGDKCAIIKVVTTQQGFVWAGDQLGITASEYKVGEYWLYVPYGAKKLTIKHNDLGILRDYVYPLPIKEASVYIMELASGKVVTTVVEEEIKTTWVVIESDPAEADVFIDETWVGTTPFQKKLIAGTYAYRIEKSLYHTSAGKIEVTGEEPKVTLPIIMNPAFGYAQINSTPESGATILIDGTETNAVTPYTTDKLKTGIHRATVKKTMFQPRTVEFEVVDGQTTNVQIEMTGNFAQVQIYTNPESDIYIDAQKVGFGTYTGRVIEGFHTFEAQKDKHVSNKSQREVKAGEDVILNLNPTPRYGTLDVTTTPIGATIFLNNQNYGTTPNTLKKLLIGDYSLLLSKDGYAKVNKTITILENQTTEINEKLPSGLSVNIITDPSGADVYIDGMKYGTSPLTTPLRFGNYKVEVKKSGVTLTNNINVTEGGQTSWNFKFSGEEFDWQKVTASPTLDGFKGYIALYPYGAHKNEANEEIAYLEAKKSDYIEPYELYASKYPNGKYIAEVRSTMEKSYISIADTYFKNSNYSAAKKYYSKYLETFPSGSQSTYATAQLGIIDNQSKKEQRLAERQNRKQNRADIHYTYLSYYYSSTTPISFYWESMKGKGLGAFWGIRMNADIFTTGTYYTVDNSGAVSDDAVFPNVSPTGNYRYGNITSTFGLTYSVAPTIWLYGGLGLGYEPEFWELDVYYDDGEYYETNWVRNTDETRFIVPLEIGVKFCLKRVNFGWGYNIYNFDLKDRETAISFGFNF